jgi:hypothetical protein
MFLARPVGAAYRESPGSDDVRGGELDGRDKDISVEWTAAGHRPLRLSFGSSSPLARQIEQGAPDNGCASADKK